MPIRGTPRAVRPSDLDGCRLGLVAVDDASRPVLDLVAAVLRRRHPLGSCEWVGAEASEALARDCDAVIVGVGDAGAAAAELEAAGVPCALIADVDDGDLARLRNVGTGPLVSQVEDQLIARAEPASDVPAGGPSCAC